MPEHLTRYSVYIHPSQHSEAPKEQINATDLSDILGPSEHLYSDEFHPHRFYPYDFSISKAIGQRVLLRWQRVENYAKTIKQKVISWYRSLDNSNEE